MINPGRTKNGTRLGEKGKKGNKILKSKAWYFYTKAKYKTLSIREIQNGLEGLLEYTNKAFHIISGVEEKT